MTTRWWRGWLAVAAFGLWSCTAADNLSYGAIVGELDAILRLPTAPGDAKVGYRDRAAVSVWYMRSPLTWPLRWPLGALLGEVAEADLDNPVGHVRELLAELPDEVGSDLGRAADAFVRLLLLAELDAGVGVRMLALDGLGRLVAQFGIPAFTAPEPLFAGPAERRHAEAARAAAQLLSSGDAAALVGAGAAGLQDALAAVGDRPLPSSRERLQWLHDLGAAWRDPARRSLRGLVEPHLRTALRHGYEALLLELLATRDPQLVELRLCSLQQACGAGGPALVPWLLAHLAATLPEALRNGHRLDPEPLVELRLIHLCGQLRGELALHAVRLPGREAWQDLAPAEYLARIVLNEQGFASPLRTPALAALSLCLERPRYDYDPAWVRTWHLERLR